MTGTVNSHKKKDYAFLAIHAMYDSVAFCLPADVVRNTNLLHEIPDHLSNHVVITERTGRRYVKGNLKGILTVNINEHCLKISKGSLAKYHHGNNLGLLGRCTVKESIEMLSDELHLPMKRADVYRMDIACTINTKFKPASYFPFLGDSNYLNREMIKGSLYYLNERRAINFYDKTQELINCPPIIPINPPIPIGANILRYELRYKRGLKHQFKLAVKAETLHDDDFYCDLIKRLHNAYNSISKLPDINNVLPDLKTPTDFINNIYLNGIKSMGGANEILKQAKGYTFSKPEYKSRTIKRIKQICCQAYPVEGYDLISELNNSIELGINYLHGN